jgi:hypothetical protein
MKRGYYYVLNYSFEGSAPSTPAGPGIYGVDEPDQFTPEYYDDDFGLIYFPEEDSLTWSHFLRPDGDMNGMVTISDLTALGANLGESGPWTVGSREWLIDGNRNGLIEIGDLSLIGRRLMIALDGVHAYHSTAAEGPPTDRFADFGQPLVGDPAPGDWVWVRATLDDFTGPACGIQQIP